MCIRSLKTRCLIVLGALLSTAMGATLVSEHYTSIAGLENLMKTEAVLLKDASAYISSSRRQIDLLESEINRIESEHNLAADNIESYISNPINAFRLITRLNYDWQTYEYRIRSANAIFIESMAKNRQTLSFPNLEDLNGSAEALARLQSTYKLDVSDVAAGILNGVKYGADMSWQHCLRMGQQMLNMEDFDLAKLWLKESMNRLTQSHWHAEPSILDIMESVAGGLYYLGEPEHALNLSNAMLGVDPQHSGALDLKKSILENDRRSVAPFTSKRYAFHDTHQFKDYEKLCRGEIAQTPKQLNPLRCRYESRHHPYLLLQPLKIEEHNLDPLVVTFHEMLTNDLEINAIKQMASPQLERSTVFSSHPYKTGVTSSNRISKHTWLDYHDHECMGKMLQRIKDATGLDTTYSEKLQVANYGLGGHYEPHWDFFTLDSNIPPGQGNRIATAIYYLSDVEQGGSTVFPFLNVAVKPKKGNVLFWYNLHRSLDRDYRTRHAGCPVLKGSKWIGNIWIHDAMQTFIRPCGLQRDNEISHQWISEIKENVR